MSRAAVARLSGLSTAAIKAYETGARTPSREALTAIIDALGLPREESNPIYAGAGYAIDWYTLLRGRYLFDLREARQQLDALPWPAFIANQSFDVVHANLSMRQLLGVEPTEPLDDVAERNLFAGAALARFARCMENFDELLAFMIGLAKGDPRRPQDLTRPAPWLKESAARILSADGETVEKYLQIWQSAAPLEHKMTHHYRVCWQREDGRRAEFLCLLTTADIWDELSRNDWIPATADDWRAMEQMTARLPAEARE